MKRAESNPWVDRYRGLDEEATIRSVLCMPTPKIPCLYGMAAWDARKEIVSHLERVFVVTSQVVTALQRVVCHCRSAARKRYGTQEQFLQKIYSGRAEFEESTAWDLHNIPLAIIGRAGDGKSSVASAACRLISTAPTFSVNADHPSIERRGLQLLRVGDRKDSLRLLNNAGSSAGYWLAGRPPEDAAAVFAHCSYRDGLAGLVADEFQNSTRSRTAGAEAAGNLLRICETGVAICFICNFSLYNKIRLQDHPVIDRLLGDLLPFLPSAPDSEDWHSLVSTYLDALEEITELRPSEPLSRILGNLVATSPRYMKNLLSRGYVVAREQGRKKMTYLDLLGAYRSTGFTPYRELIEAQFSPNTKKLKISNRDDVFFPDGLLEKAYVLDRSSHERALQEDAVKGTFIPRRSPATEISPAEMPKKSTQAGISLEELAKNYAAISGQ